MSNKGSVKPSEDCCICLEFESQTFGKRYAEVYGIKNRICYHSKNVVLVPSISPLAPGHVLIFPKQHVRSIMQVSSEVLKEIGGVAGYVFEHILQEYDKVPYIFEHGVGACKQGGCGINHAHLHMVPVQPRQVEIINRLIARDFSADRTIKLADLREVNALDRSYLLYGTDLNTMSLKVKDDIPSQYHRQKIAQSNGSTAWDWRELTGISDFNETCFNLRDFRKRASIVSVAAGVRTW